MEDKVVWVKYIDEYEDLAGFKHPKYKSKRVVLSYTKRYHNCLYLLADLRASCRNLMDYLCEQMDSNNLVHSNEAVRQAFIDFISHITNSEVVYTQATVKRSFNILAEKKLLIPKSRGTYIVNPEFFFNRSDKERIKEIQMILSFKDK